MTRPHWTVAQSMAVVLLIGLGLAALINSSRKTSRIANLAARIKKIEADASRKRNTLLTIIGEMRDRLEQSGRATELAGRQPTNVDHRPLRFALVGKIDVNGDGKDDRTEVRRMIQESGGIIEFDLPPPDVGAESGALTSRIDWYVIDDRMPLRDGHPSDSDQSLIQHSRFNQRTGEIIKEARQNGIRPLTLGNWAADRIPKTGDASGGRSRRAE